ncbi:Rpn family recombination-promoting nuclease/putative transposase [Halanaerobium sp.]|uniref:Rpn family recombination-promoting nuclease/putative transposase n=1 Tax=Halanaerobium sp. TaxID=1895664 RepID=UPI0025B9B143|nr:Rpn family recombination-promoting nuclease/putative transposase [Halanaerobium sp.]
MEHKSYPDKEVSLQLLKYMMDCQSFLKQNNSVKLPVIITFLIHHGGKRYNIDVKFNLIIPERSEILMSTADKLREEVDILLACSYCHERGFLKETCEVAE